ncbi:hypothetical protein AB0L56_09710 [Streptomyces sp. NPDC052079]|uniref:hypothetical protein n=1 Tax=Streptomyces sp. NPDC052079 TaxID=3155526 RepID=UPI00342F11DF
MLAGRRKPVFDDRHLRGTGAWILALLAAAGCTSGNGTGGSAAVPARPTATERQATDGPPIVVTVHAKGPRPPVRHARRADEGMATN